MIRGLIGCTRAYFHTQFVVQQPRGTTEREKERDKRCRRGNGKNVRVGKADVQKVAE